MQILLLQKAVVINSTNSGSVLCDLLKCLLGNKIVASTYLHVLQHTALRAQELRLPLMSNGIMASFKASC